LLCGCIDDNKEHRCVGPDFAENPISATGFVQTIIQLNNDRQKTDCHNHSLLAGLHDFRFCEPRFNTITQLIHYYRRQANMAEEFLFYVNKQRKQRNMQYYYK
jgi:hypothetical protein